MPVREEAFTLDSPRSGGVIDGDVRFPEGADAPLPVVVFCHGFKGFKDWGPFPAWGRFLAEAGFASVLFNFSYNGVAAEAPTEFTELGKFEENTFTRELDDLAAVIEAAEDGDLPGPSPDVQPGSAEDGHAGSGGRLGLIGHSRGGGTAILHAARDERVQALATWSAVSSFIERFGAKQVRDWEEQGYATVQNSRTGQTMRLGRVLYDDAKAHREQLDVLAAARQMQKPWLLVHSRADEAVSFAEAEALHAAAPQAELVEAEGGHTFGGAHPFDGKSAADVPASVRDVWERTRTFFEETLTPDA
ncbi:MAG: alpha/beta hydrolase [Bacteroidetes bacterium QS_9_68_14]|nr:MAG: alpha/beta hydrolase [Bacteroidetes bacterium QS_9_68_14]